MQKSLDFIIDKYKGVETAPLISISEPKERVFKVEDIVYYYNIPFRVEAINKKSYYLSDRLGNNLCYFNYNAILVAKNDPNLKAGAEQRD